jgi:RNA polymerase sigma factor (sigma-70 family)
MQVTRSPDDATAIRASRAKPEAFEAVFHRHWPRVYRYCVSRLGAGGEDVAAETFRVAFDQRGRYDGREDAAPWLLGIATNLVRAWFRSAARGARAHERAASEPAPDDVDDLLDRLEAERLGPNLAFVLQTLDSAGRDALLLHVLAELSYEQIARATEVPIGTVSSRINRARARARTHLEQLELT